MSDRISKCCGWGVHLGGIPSADPTAQVTEFYACDQCMKACDVETIEQRDHRMRVLGARLALRNGINSPKVSSSLLGVIEQSAEIIVAAFEREQCIVAERAHSARLAERVAELEQMYAEMKDAADKGSKSVFALAALQAENVRLREVLDRLRDLAEIGLPMKATLVHAITHDVLAQSPSSNAALREVCRRVAMKGLKSGRVVMDDGTYVPLEDQAAQIVDAILGPEVAR